MGIFKIAEVCSPNFWATYFRGKNNVSILTKIGLGYILGDFLHTYSFGHPDTLP
jgi:hypothetical protein